MASASSATLAGRDRVAVHDAARSLNTAWLVVGLGLAVFGFMIYYLLPLSLLSFNLALFFNIFFGILLGV